MAKAIHATTGAYLAMPKWVRLVIAFVGGIAGSGALPIHF